MRRLRLPISTINVAKCRFFGGEISIVSGVVVVSTVLILQKLSQAAAWECDLFPRVPSGAVAITMFPACSKQRGGESSHESSVSYGFWSSWMFRLNGIADTTVLVRRGSTVYNFITTSTTRSDGNATRSSRVVGKPAAWKYRSVPGLLTWQNSRGLLCESGAGRGPLCGTDDEG